MITIKPPQVEIKNGKARLQADLSIDGELHPLWIEVEEKYGQYLCHERGDAFVLGLLHYAMRYGHDIKCEAPMTARLYEQLTEQFLPALYKINKFKDRCDNNKIRGGYAVRIEAPLADEVEHPTGGTAVGSGVSCGVDSLHVFAKHPEITHGCIWHAYGVVADETKERKERSWQNVSTRAKQFCEYTGRELVVVDTNFDRGCVDGLQWDGMTTYGNLFCVLALQKLWSKYYIASGYDIDDFRLTGVPASDPAHYEWVLFQICSMRNISIRMDGVAQNRVEKVRDLIDYEPAKKFLSVCHEITEDGSNCNHYCAKCMRTMLDLDALGALDEFKNVFDVAYYKEYFHEYLAELYRGYLQHNNFAVELKPYFRNRHYPLKTQLAAARIVLSKAIKKVLRGGTTRHGKFSSKG